MSWLNTAGIASLAKSALKEAQKTIDKALDIKDNVTIGNTLHDPFSTNTAALGKEIESFFESFGLLGKESEEKEQPASDKLPQDVVVSEPGSSNKNEEIIDPPDGTVGEHPHPVVEEPVPLKVKDEEETTASGSQSNEELPGSSFEGVEVSLDKVDLPMSNSNNEQSTETLSASTVTLPHSTIWPSFSAPNTSKDLSSNDSCHSSYSTSSSVTVISPESELSTKPEAEAISYPNSTDGVSPTDDLRSRVGQLIGEEVSTKLSEAMRDSMRTENSASVSGDEVETTTSSDIEIIASPQAGIRKLHPPMHGRGNEQLPTHKRIPSEASSEDSVTSALEVDKTGRKVAELSQLLEARENKLVELNRTCAALTDEVEELKSRLAQDVYKERLAVGEAVRRQTEDFAQRLSSVEKRYQQALAERDALAAQLEGVKHSKEVFDQVQEKEEVIKELRLEGEKLSKQHFQQSTIIKKLRAKEKEDEQQLKQLKDKNEDLTREMERLKKCLSAKEELEKSQIDHIRQLSTAKDQLEKELMTNKVLARDAHLELESLRTVLADTKRELDKVRAEAAAKDSAETERNLSVEVSLRQKLQMEFEATTRLFEEERQMLTLRCQELVHALAVVDSDRSREREQAKNELSRLMQRYQEAEARSDELSQAVTTSTRPLLRQIDALQSQLSSLRLTEEKNEKILEEKLNAVQSQLQSAVDKENASRNAFVTMQTRVSELSERLDLVTRENQQLSNQLAQEKASNRNLQEEKENADSSIQLVKKELGDEVQALRRKLHVLERNYELQTVTLEEEKRKSARLSERLQEKEQNKGFQTDTTNNAVPVGMIRTISSEADASLNSRSSSPTPSLGKLSLSGSFTESHSSNPWISTDEVFDNGLTTPVPKSTLYDTMKAGSYTAVFESLQSQLKTRDGELVQLQQELQNREKTRDSLAQELAKMINSNQEMSQRLEQLEQRTAELDGLKTKYNALLQMYGEKIEENEELRLDLVDVKEMYKAQIDQLMKM